MYVLYIHTYIHPCPSPGDAARAVALTADGTVRLPRHGGCVMARSSPPPLAATPRRSLLFLAHTGRRARGPRAPLERRTAPFLPRRLWRQPWVWACVAVRIFLPRVLEERATHGRTCHRRSAPVPSSPRPRSSLANVFVSGRSTQALGRPVGVTRRLDGRAEALPPPPPPLSVSHPPPMGGRRPGLVVAAIPTAAAAAAAAVAGDGARRGTVCRNRASHMVRDGIRGGAGGGDSRIGDEEGGGRRPRRGRGTGAKRFAASGALTLHPPKGAAIFRLVSSFHSHLYEQLCIWSDQRRFHARPRPTTDR